MSNVWVSNSTMKEGRGRITENFCSKSKKNPSANCPSFRNMPCKFCKQPHGISKRRELSKALLPQDASRTWIGSASFKLGGGCQENTWQLVCRVDCGTVNFLSVPLSPLILRLEGKQFLHFKLPKVKKQDYTNSF